MIATCIDSFKKGLDNFMKATATKVNNLDGYVEPPCPDVISYVSGFQLLGGATRGAGCCFCAVLAWLPKSIRLASVDPIQQGPYIHMGPKKMNKWIIRGLVHTVA